MTTVSDILKHIKNNDIRFMDLRYTDPRGQFHYMTVDSGLVNEGMFTDGMMFDASFIIG